ncbi:CopG family transcriptional regulator [Desulfotomaculum copahuensis]|uniref:CopG family transcriptional regulator n=1 Tax=Desulfotomaculum copahuensis TaxID=1838280 RepID=A0A1B7LDM8_9FIRM|nr:CopG family transcriptional regulator [Desulfotomaculum copahuensis]OAT81214.1 CopG family transcriptional regulator [Desulfotomaculum copahuensis]
MTDHEWASVKIPAELFREIEKRIKETGFASVDEYVAFVLREVVFDDAEQELAGDDEEVVKERLRSLGYLD